MYFDAYRSKVGFVSLYSCIPIEYLDDFKEYAREVDLKYRIVYRGKNRRKLARNVFVYDKVAGKMDYTKKTIEYIHLDCLKKDAQAFTVYPNY